MEMDQLNMLLERTAMQVNESFDILCVIRYGENGTTEPHGP